MRCHILHTCQPAGIFTRCSPYSAQTRLIGCPAHVLVLFLALALLNDVWPEKSRNGILGSARGAESKSRSLQLLHLPLHALGPVSTRPLRVKRAITRTGCFAHKLRARAQLWPPITRSTPDLQHTTRGTAASSTAPQWNSSTKHALHSEF